MITDSILCVVTNHLMLGMAKDIPAIVATEHYLHMLTSVMVTSTVVCLHLNLDRTNVLVVNILMLDVRMAS